MRKLLRVGAKCQVSLNDEYVGKVLDRAKEDLVNIVLLSPVDPDVGSDQ